MLMTALAQLKTNYRRLIAITLALGISVAFIQGTMMFTNTMNSVVTQSIAQDVSKADLVVKPVEKTNDNNYIPLISESNLEKVKNTANVKDVGEKFSGIYGNFSGTNIPVTINETPPADLNPHNIIEGSLPEGQNEITLDQATANARKIKIDDVIDLDVIVAGQSTDQSQQGDASGDNPNSANGSRTETFHPQVVGITQSTQNTMGAAAAVFASDDLIEKWAPQSSNSQVSLSLLTVKADDPAHTTDLKEQLTHEVGSDVTVMTQKEYVDDQLNALSSGSAGIIGFIWLFIVVAIAVAAMVIANTFTVLLAQRTRELALLRCLGAQSKQLKRSVLLEAGIVGLVASLGGTILSYLAFKGIVAYAVLTNIMPAGVEASLKPNQALLACTIGIGLAMAASYMPAKKATQLAPIEALHPLQEATITNKQGKVKVKVGVLLFILGGAGLVFGAIQHEPTLAIFTGILSFLGLLLVSGLVIPALLGSLSKIISDNKVTAKLAALNTVRNPRRTASAATALLIGVSLVSSIMAGAATAKATMSAEIDKTCSIDLMIKQPANNESFDDAALDKASKISGVDQVVRGSRIPLQLDGESVDVFVSAPEDYAKATRDPGVKPIEGSLVVPQASTLKDTVNIQGPDGNITIPVVKEDITRQNPVKLILTPEDAAKVDQNAAENVLIFKTKDGLDSKQVQDVQNSAVEEFNLTPDDTAGGLSMRFTVNTMINSLMAVLIGLLAFAVVIAMIGIANTASLSVLERTRESSLLRALGLTKTQLRTMLGIESLLIASISAVVAITAGSTLGVLGATAILGKVWSVTIALPWLQLILLLFISAAAGIIATIVPSKKAAKLSPVEGLAEQ
ncbi:MAG: ABC transporter permease [Micrococcaceae bacterium]